MNSSGGTGTIKVGLAGKSVTLLFVENHNNKEEAQGVIKGVRAKNPIYWTIPVNNSICNGFVYNTEIDVICYLAGCLFRNLSIDSL